MEGTSSSTGALVPSVSGFISIKLDRTNYPIWLAQIVMILKSKNLMGFVNDQMILSWINNSLSPPVLSTVARFTSSHATWSSLEKRYASQSKNRILQLRNDLLTTKGEGLSISDFVDKINHIANNLAFAGKPIDDDELVTIIMNNVGPAFEVNVSSAQARDSPNLIDDLVALLLTAEMRIKAQQIPSLETTPTALYAPKSTNHSSRGHGSFNLLGSPMRGRGSSGTRHPPWSSSSSGPVNYGSASSTTSRPTCQICSRFGHSSIDCFQGMNQAYEGRVPTQKLTTMADVASMNTPRITWISNTGASNHITLDLANLVIHNDYHGKDRVAVGNGVGLSIAHIDSNKILHGSSSFAMNNILHCPSIAANLLSLYQFL
uniref:Retrovirus-related Pol polyprotein from transposon TNT 1-94-like beta-barrel domain-containing protein n=1 Tax=Fagus sylvatica TaxID=28930 RepID=A0A2N9FH14_FAGSY